MSSFLLVARLAELDSPSPTATFSGFSSIPEALACIRRSVEKSCSVMP